MFCCRPFPPPHPCKHKKEEKYISLLRGDDTDFSGGTGLTFAFEVPLQSMDGYKIEFEFLNIKKTVTAFEKIGDNKFSFTLQFTHAETVDLPLCFQYATMTLIETIIQTVDGNQEEENQPIVITSEKRRTIANDILMHITDDVDEVYGNDNAYSVNIKPGTIFGAFTGLTFDLNDTLENRMAQIANIFRVGNGTVVPKE